MAELGIVASLISISGAAATIARGLYQVASDIGTAGKEVRLIAQDTNAFSQALTNLSQMLQGGTANTERARVIVQDLIVLCRDILSDSNALLKVLEPLVKLTGKKWKRSILRVRWLFEKSKFAIHRQSLEALKSTLALLIATMTYVDASKANVSEQVSASLRAQLESIREEVKLSTKDYEPLLLQIQDNVQTIRAEALLAYSKLDGEQVIEEDQQPEDEHDGNTNASGTVAVETTNTQSPANEALDLAEPVTTLSIHTGLPGLPYLQRQAVHLADNVLDATREILLEPSLKSAGSGVVVHEPQWQREHNFGEAILQLTASPQSPSNAIGEVTDPPSESRDDRNRRKWDRARQKYDLVKKEASTKIAFNDFRKGDLALFLPTRNFPSSAWAAFNTRSPHYFLKGTSDMRLDKRDWMVARIKHIDRRKVDPTKANDREHNPFELSNGLVWYMVDVDPKAGDAKELQEKSEKSIQRAKQEHAAQKTGGKMDEEAAVLAAVLQYTDIVDEDRTRNDPRPGHVNE